MDVMILERLEKAKTATPTWDPAAGGKLSWIRFVDTKTVLLPNPNRFEAICDEILNGRYYPADAVEFFADELPLRPGTRIVQRAPFLFLRLWSVAEIFIADQSAQELKFGYVTTNQHHGRGIWQIILTKQQDNIRLKIDSTVTPGSLLFWLGLPVARFLQLRARRRGIENLKRLALLPAEV